MAITAVTASANTSVGTTAASFTLTSPTGTQAGDVLVCAVSVHTSPDATTGVADTATGTLSFTKLASVSQTNASVSLWYRVVQAGDPTSWTVSFDTARNYAAALMAYRGVDNTTPIDAQGTAGTGSGSPGTYNAVTTVTANAWYVGAMAAQAAGAELSSLSSGSPTPTVRADLGNGANLSSKESCSLIDAPITAAGSSGTFVYTLVTSAFWGTFSFALRPVTDPFPAGYTVGPQQELENAVYRY